MHCTRCGAEIKAGLRPRTMIQKAAGLVLCDADRDEVRPGDVWSEQCPDCEDERESNP